MSPRASPPPVPALALKEEELKWLAICWPSSDNCFRPCPYQSHSRQYILESGLLLLPSCVDEGQSVPCSRSQFFRLQNGRVGTGMVSKVTPGWGALQNSDISLVVIPKVSCSAGLQWGLGYPFNRTPRRCTCTARSGHISLL